MCKHECRTGFYSTCVICPTLFAQRYHHCFRTFSNLLKVSTRFWNILQRFYAFQKILTHSETFQNMLVPFRRFYNIVEHFGASQNTFKFTGSLKNIQKHGRTFSKLSEDFLAFGNILEPKLSERFQNILKLTGRIGSTLEPSARFQNTRTFWNIVKHA